MKKISKKEIILLSLFILLQTVIFLIVGTHKEYIHIDEAFSMGLTNYDIVKLQNKEGFYNTWHDNEYYKDYLVVNEDEKFDFRPVYINQKNDVHPPLFYLLLRIAMNFHVGKFSMWSGIVLNIIIYAFITIFMYLIMKKIFHRKDKFSLSVLAFVSSITMLSLTSVMYIRMYALSTLNVLITTYLHLKLLDSKEVDYKLLICIGISALAGSLTHYYYLFYLAMLFIMFAIKYLKEKKYKILVRYFITMSIAGIVSILIFPYSIKHMFFGYRGQGAISNLAKISEFLKSIKTYLLKINLLEFNGILIVLLLISIAIIIYKLIRKIPLVKDKNQYIKYMILPSIFYFLLVALSAPWKEIRYMMPICGIIFIIVFYYLEELLSNLLKPKALNITVITILLSLLVIPLALNNMNIENKYKPKIDVLYEGNKEIVDKLSNELNVPTLYMAKAKNVRFQDDILLFANLKESYVAEGIEVNKQNIFEIMKHKNLSNGILVFINEGQDNNSILSTIKEALSFEKVEHIKRMNACDIYYVKN